MLISTHSPYFLKAIEVHSNEHKNSDKCRYYLAKNIENKPIAEIIDAIDKIYEIYKVLAEPLNILDKLEEELA